MAEGLAVFDSDARLRFANPAFKGMYAGLKDLLEPGLLWDIFLREAVHRHAMPAQAAQTLESLETALLDIPQAPAPVTLAFGRGRFYEIRLASASDGGFYLVQAPGSDSTGEADAAREAEALLRNVLEACPTCLIMARVGDGQILYRSPAATQLLGNAKSSFTYFAFREERGDFVTALLSDEKTDHMRATCLRPDGTTFSAEISARLIDYRGEDVIVASIEDLTHELSVQDELQRQQEQLFLSEKLSALGEMLAGIAHELNNPLSIIVGNAEILREELEQSPHENRIDKLARAAHRCVNIVRSFLSLARQEQLNLKSTEVKHLFDTAIEVVAPEAAKSNIRILGRLPAQLPEIMVDDVQITQVVINLMTNALHAMRDARQGSRIHYTCEADPSSGQIKMLISDDGPGVDPTIAHRIFDPLFTTKDVGKGTGVGLAFCHRIIAAHKGQITLEKQNGDGAIFSVSLPIAVTD